MSEVKEEVKTETVSTPEVREKKPFVKREKKEYNGEHTEGTRPARPSQRSKKKPCPFCMDKKPIDYKDSNRLRKFMTEKGKILPSRQTGVCARHQRALTTAIKVARNMALLPFKGE